MKIKKIISKERILLDLAGETKDAVIEEMLDFLIIANNITSIDRDEALQALLTREVKMSTGMQGGVAIPHAKTKVVDRMYVAIALSRKGVDFDALDGQVSRIFIMTLSPIDRSGPHIQFLAEIGRILNNETIKEQILAAQTAAEVLHLL